MINCTGRGPKGEPPRQIAYKGMVKCNKITYGSWTGEPYGCTFRINHWGPCNYDGTVRQPGDRW